MLHKYELDTSFFDVVMAHKTIPDDYAISEDEYEPDPVFVNSWRETLVIISLFVVFMFWTVCVSFLLGHEATYLKDGGDLALVWGMPSWVFYGVFLPWMIVNLIGVWFCFGFMKNDELEDIRENVGKNGKESP